MSVTQEQVIEYISNLKLVEVKDLIEKLETTLGVEASAPVMMGAMPAGGAPAEEVEEKTEFDVVLKSLVPRRSTSSRSFGPRSASV